MKVDPATIEETAKLLYIRALKALPTDIKQGFQKLDASEGDPTGRAILATMIQNIAVAGIPIYNVTIGRGVELDGAALKQAIRRGCERATREYPLRSSVVHPITRVNEHSSCGRLVPVINIDFCDRTDELAIEMIPKGSGSENGSFLKMCIPADGVDGIKTFVIDRVMEAGGKVCPPTIVGVGIGGTSDLCAHLAKVAATRPLGTVCEDAEGARLEMQLCAA
ncbi:MAG: fumarate hydratase, partial [Alphaproteobacteria bacterium]|nr:fumarate hydratase [Alphaproteobacteria bacterium]